MIAIDKTGLVLILPANLTPSPENEILYGHLDTAETWKLAESIRANGVLDPLIVTADHRIVSGHRRHLAVVALGIDGDAPSPLPCRVLAKTRAEFTDDEFIKLLREHNRYREKTFAEKLREEVLTVDPQAAYESLTEHRQGKALVNLEKMELGEVRERAVISAAKYPMTQAIKSVVNANIKFWPLSVRQVHYRLLNAPPLIHASKPKSVYQNNLSSYKALSELLTRLRLTDIIPWSAIDDPTRPIETWYTYDDVRAFVRRELNGFCKGYRRNLLLSQPNHVEIICEKNTVLTILKEVASEYTAPITSGRGFCSIEPRRAMVERYTNSGGDKLILLILADLDPDGEAIATSAARSLRDDLKLADGQIHAIKVGLTLEHVKRFNLPSNMRAKESSTNYAKFAAQYGEYAYELESIEPAALQGLLRDALDSVVDHEAFNAELIAEKRDAVELAAFRKTMVAQMGDAASVCGSSGL